jgi:hypothetical protein
VVDAAIQPADEPELLHTVAGVGCHINVSKPMKNFVAN